MKIFRHKKNRRLYTIVYVNPPMILGWHYEAIPYKRQGKIIKFDAAPYKNTLPEGITKLFEVVAEK